MSETNGAPKPIKPYKAVWHGPDYDNFVTVIGDWGTREDGRRYLQIEEGTMPIPADEIKVALPDPINVSLHDFARAFRFGAGPVFNFRVLQPKLANIKKPTKEDLAPFAKAKVPYFAWLQSALEPYGVDSRPFNRDVGLEALTDDKNKAIQKLRRTNAGPESRAVYFVVNQGGQEKKDIKQFTAFFGEWDDVSIEEQYARVMSFAIAPHVVIKTRSSLHCYWLAVEETTQAEWESVQRTFIVANNSDPSICDLPRVMRVPGFDHTTFDFETGQVSRVPVTCLKFDTGERIPAAQMLEMLSVAGQAEVSRAEFEAWRRARNANNKQRVKVRQKRERKGEKHKPLYEGEPPADLKQVHGDICERVTIVAPAGAGVRAICPVCEDPNPSLIITLTPDNILMVDHAGCTFGELCDFFGIEPKHCFARKPRDEANDGADPSIPRGFFKKENGDIYGFYGSDAAPIYVSSPLNVLAITRDTDAGNWGKWLEWFDLDEIVHRYAMPIAELSGDGREWLRHLMGEGLRVGSSRKAKELLSDFIQQSNPQTKARCVTKPGWHDNTYIDPIGAINPPDGELIILQAATKDPPGIRGTLDEWKEHVGQHCRHNTLRLFGVSAAFAAKLLHPLSLENAGFHLRGDSSQGKTTTLQVAASVDGRGAEKGAYVESWRGTANGLEAVCARHNDSILPLTEIGQCDPRVVGDVAYLIVNGQEKARGTKLGGMRTRAWWRIITLSDGELSLAQHSLEAGKRVRGGQEVRLVDIPVRDRQFGAFDSVNGFASGKEFADHLKKAVSTQYYGTAGRAFVEKLTADPKFSQINQEWTNFRAEFISKLAISKASGEVSRVADKFAMVGFAGEMATRYDLTAWKKDDATDAAQELFLEWLSARGGTGGADAENVIRQVRLFIELHGDARFRRIGDAAPVNEEGVAADTRTIYNRAGLFDGETYFFSRQVFQDEVCKGFDATQAAKALKQAGFLEVSIRLQYEKRDPDSRNDKARFYAVSKAILESE